MRYYMLQNRKFVVKFYKKIEVVHFQVDVHKFGLV